MKPLLFFTDPHLSDKRIKSRIDDSRETAERKLTCIGDLAEELDAFIVCGGDLLDYWNWRADSAYQIGLMIKRTLKGKVFSVAGNHDMRGASKELLKYTGYGMLRNDGIISWSTGDSVFDIYTSDWCDWGAVEEAEHVCWVIKDDEEAIKYTKHISVWVAHINVGDHAAPHVIHYNDLDLPDNLDFFLCGDIHKGFLAKHKNGHTICCNPGAMMRCGLDEATNKPGVFIIYPDGKFERRDIPCEPPEKVFNLEAHKEKKQLHFDFNSASEAANRMKALDKKDLIREVAKVGNFSDHSMNRLIEELDKKI